MSDNELTKLFTNALELIHKKSDGKYMVKDAQEVLKAIQAEWSKRLDAYNDGEYKAETPKKECSKLLDTV